MKAGPSRWARPTRSDKVSEVAAVAARLAPLRRRKRTVVLSQGCFDLLHLGHVRHFREARSLGDLLVIAVTEDRYVDKGPDRPLFPLAMRMEMLAELECVDAVVPSLTATAVPVLQTLRPDVYVQGAEYEQEKYDDPRFIAERAVVDSYGGVVAFSHDPLVCSSTRLQRSLP